MSSSSITDPRSLRNAVSGLSVSRLLVRPVKQLSFWAAIVLPFMHLSLLATGLDSQSMTAAFVVLVALNVCTLYIGHPYGVE
ncbi:hypothetical protein GRX03_14680 [Halovenus sp. WSH3]|uniref:Uncharacterized protein n=1 Tax=Halovenus carboxidivorans TaxID=2692199 RepID=A0A6B0T9C5_9EURY|nr:hypothetical protein [Halovenus carboxidivorans]MXR52846.1 hypothetical protein [Halovenus carboxidivorans]